jgi:hypothetical protein
MMKKWFLLFALAGLSIASAKTYDVALDRPYMVGKTELKAGDYHLKLEGSKAVLMDTSTKKETQANIKVQDAKKKFDYNELVSRKAQPADRLTQINLGGTRTEVEFD